MFLWNYVSVFETQEHGLRLNLLQFFQSETDITAYAENGLNFYRLKTCLYCNISGTARQISGATR